MPTTCGNTSSLGITHEDDTKIGATITSTPVETATAPAVSETPVETATAPAISETPVETATAPAVSEAPTTPETVTLAAVTASAISTNKIAFTFNKAVTASAIKADSVIVKEASERKFVKSVSADANDTKTLIVELYDNLATGKTYNVSIPVEGKAYVLDVAYTQAKVSKIVVEDQIVPAGTEKAIKYTVLDANGLDVTGVTDVTFTSNKTITKDGKITLANDKETAFVQVETVLADGTSVKSDRFTVTANARVADTLANYTTSADEVKFDATDYKQDLNVLKSAKDVKVVAQIKDQFGDVVETGTTYESLDTTVAVVDKNSGTIIPLKVGTVPVKISNGSFSKTIVIAIVAESQAQKLVVEKTALTIYPQLENKTVTTKVYTEDQYGKPNVENIVAKVISGEDLVKAEVTDGVLTVTASAVKAEGSTEYKTGTAVVKVTKGDFTQNVVVTIDKLGAVVGYDTVGTKATLDKNASTTTTAADYQADEMTFYLNPVDKDGKIAGNPEEFSYEIKEGTTVVASGSAVKTLKIKIDEKVNEKATSEIKTNKTYKVALKVGSLTVKEFQFDTVDTRVAPSVTLAKNTATISATSAAAITDKDALLVTLVSAGVITTSDKECEFSNLDFVSADKNFINADGAYQDGKFGKVTIVLNTVDVTNAKGKFTVALSGAIDLVVSEKTTEEIAADEKAEAKKAAEDAIDALSKASGYTNVDSIADTDYNAEVVANAKKAVEAYTKIDGAKLADLTGNAKYTAIMDKIAENIAKDAADKDIASTVAALKAVVADGAANADSATGTVDFSNVELKGCAIKLADGTGSESTSFETVNDTAKTVAVNVSDWSAGTETDTFTIEVSKSKGTTKTLTFTITATSNSAYTVACTGEA